MRGIPQRVLNQVPNYRPALEAVADAAGSSAPDRLRAIVGEAITGLDLRFVHNRPTEVAVDLLDSGTQLTNGFYPGAQPLPTKFNLHHDAWKIYDGTNLNRIESDTIFASLELRERGGFSLEELAGSQHLANPYYGNISFILTPESYERMTLLATDSYSATGYSNALTGVDQLTNVIAEHVARRHGLAQLRVGTIDAQWGAKSVQLEPIDLSLIADHRPDELLGLLEMPYDEAVQRMRKVLVDLMGINRPTSVEAQLFGARTSDIGAIHVGFPQTDRDKIAAKRLITDGRSLLEKLHLKKPDFSRLPDIIQTRAGDIPVSSFVKTKS